MTTPPAPLTMAERRAILRNILLACAICLPFICALTAWTYYAPLVFRWLGWSP